jgi:hypothetical protein
MTQEIVLRMPDGIPLSQIDVPFFQGMVDRMGVSWFKYGDMRAHGDGDDPVKLIESLKVRLDKYEETGNAEWLMDVGNIAMMEFVNGQHPNHHYRPTDSDESPGRVVRGRALIEGATPRDRLSDKHNKELD